MAQMEPSVARGPDFRGRLGGHGPWALLQSTQYTVDGLTRYNFIACLDGVLVPCTEILWSERADTYYA